MDRTIRWQMRSEVLVGVSLLMGAALIVIETLFMGGVSNVSAACLAIGVVGALAPSAFVACVLSWARHEHVEHQDRCPPKSVSAVVMT